MVALLTDVYYTPVVLSLDVSALEYCSLSSSLQRLRCVVVVYDPIKREVLELL